MPKEKNQSGKLDNQLSLIDYREAETLRHDNRQLSLERECRLLLLH